MVRKGLTLTIMISLLALVTVLPLQFPATVSDSDWVQIVQPQLTRSFVNSVFNYYPPPRDVIILDSNIVKERLPKMSYGNWIVLSSSQIRDSAERSGEADFIQLSKFTRLPKSARAVWEMVEVKLDPRRHEFVYEVHKVSAFNYSLTPDGWKGGLAKSEIFDYLSPRK
jgi:hypothetical protein